MRDDSAPASAATSATAGCRECVAGHPHCHGTLIRHSTQHCQCTDPECGCPDVVLHALTIGCDALGCRCGEIEADRFAV